jgi:hypothetical protein
MVRDCYGRERGSSAAASGATREAGERRIIDPVHRILPSFLLVGLLSGCSWATLRGEVLDRPGDAPIRCDPDARAPLVDMVFSVASFSAFVTSIPFLVLAPPRGRAGELAVAAGAYGGAPASVALGYSGRYGLRQNRRCAQLQADGREGSAP